MKRILVSIRLFLRDIFNLSHEQAGCEETISSVERGVEFKGVNVWTLIFAIFIASIGLNVNSTAVIIGAMLISPLMGPIMGVGMSIGIYDFSLLKKSLKNLIITVSISVITSALYFTISPLSEAQSELLSRTTPNIYDVLIALFGGLAGIVASTRKEKGNAIPGVAIATALMPPLCTAGYGLATGNLAFFFGAFYLFFINAVMISVSTFVIVRFLKFPHKEFVDRAKEVRVRTYVWIVVIVTVVPSIYFAFNIVRQTIFKTNALNYVTTEFNFPKTQILRSTYEFSSSDSSSISLLLMGKELDDSQIAEVKSRMGQYKLNNTKLKIVQGMDGNEDVSIDQLRSGIIEELYDKNQLELKTKDEQINFLKSEITTLKSVNFPVVDLAKEANAINKKVENFSLNQVVCYNIPSQRYDTTFVANIHAAPRLTRQELTSLESWLEQRVKKNKVNIVEN